MFNLKQWLRIMYTSAPWRKELLQELTNTETNKQTNHKNKQTNSCLGYALCTTAAVQQMHRQITFQFQMDPRSPLCCTMLPHSSVQCCLHSATLLLCCSAVHCRTMLPTLSYSMLLNQHSVGPWWLVNSYSMVYFEGTFYKSMPLQKQH